MFSHSIYNLPANQTINHDVDQAVVFTEVINNINGIVYDDINGIFQVEEKMILMLCCSVHWNGIVAGSRKRFIDFSPHIAELSCETLDAPALFNCCDSDCVVINCYPYPPDANGHYHFSLKVRQKQVIPATTQINTNSYLHIIRLG